MNQPLDAPLKTLTNALLIGTYRSSSDKLLAEEHLKELHRLCDTFGLIVAKTVLCPIKKIDGGTYLGKGKLEELSNLAEELSIGVFLFDDEITPHQQRNLESAWKKPVLDRTELILEVFAQRAKTKEARLQIELAQVKYQFPRLKRLWTHLSRQSSGGGFVKGEGEKQIELDRRMLRRKVEQLKKEIEEVIAQRQTQRIARKRAGIPSFALVGYTNVGKSSLMKALTDADVFVEDKLFATLDTTTRKYTLPNKQEILLVDTVGFIRKIPHTLVAAFKSTLEEVLYTDILLHIIDVSHPMAEQQAEATCQVLKELGAEHYPTLTILNKIDACPHPEWVHKFRLKYPKTVVVSAVTKEGLEELARMMMEEVTKLRAMVKVRIPQSRYDLISELMREGRIECCEYEDNDVLLTMEIPRSLQYKVKEFLL